MVGCELAKYILAGTVKIVNIGKMHALLLFKYHNTLRPRYPAIFLAGYWDQLKFSRIPSLGPCIRPKLPDAESELSDSVFGQLLNWPDTEFGW